MPGRHWPSRLSRRARMMTLWPRVASGRTALTFESAACRVVAERTRRGCPAAMRVDCSPSACSSTHTSERSATYSVTELRVHGANRAGKTCLEVRVPVGVQDHRAHQVHDVANDSGSGDLGLDSGLGGRGRRYGHAAFMRGVGPGMGCALVCG